MRPAGSYPAARGLLLALVAPVGALAQSPAAVAPSTVAPSTVAPSTLAPSTVAPSTLAPPSAAPPVPPGQPPAADASPKPAPEGWVRRVHAIVARSMASLSSTLPRGDYAVRFSIDEAGRGSRYAVEGNVGAAQAAVITAALAARAFPAPPDGASHALRFTVRMK